MAPRRGDAKTTSAPARSQRPLPGYSSSDTARAAQDASAVRREAQPPPTAEDSSEALASEAPPNMPLHTATSTTKEVYPSTKSAAEAGEASARKSLENFHSHLRRLQRRTDTMLLQRTHCRKEMQAWETSHGHLESSITALVTTLQQCIAELQSASGPSRTLSTSSHQASHSLAPFSDPASRGLITVESSNRIDECHEQYAADLSALRRQESILKESMDNLSHLEFRLQSLYDKIAEFLDSPNLDNKIRPDVLAGVVTIPKLGFKVTPTTEQPPELVSEYFDKEGDVKVFRERLRDLEAHYYEGQDAREIVKDRGDSLEVSDEQFELTHRARREKMERDLDNALQRASELGRRCKDAGYDLNFFRYRKVQGLTSSRQTSSSSGEGADPSAPLPASHMSDSTGMSDLSKSIEYWRDDIPANAPPADTRKP